jgi:hypothetical protein
MAHMRHPNPKGLHSRATHTRTYPLPQRPLDLLQAHSRSHIPKTNQLPTRLQTPCPCLQPYLKTRYTPLQALLASLSAILHYAVDDVRKVVVEALFHADGELVLSFTLGTGFAEDVAHEDF